MQTGQYIYHRDGHGDTCSGKILRFNKNFTRANIHYDSIEGYSRVAWVSIGELEPQYVEGEWRLASGEVVWMERDVVEWQGRDVVRFESPCICRANGNKAIVEELRRVMVGGEDDCPVHGFGEGA